jgi:hypothetical protein
LNKSVGSCFRLLAIAGHGVVVLSKEVKNLETLKIDSGINIRTVVSKKIESQGDKWDLIYFPEGFCSFPFLMRWCTLRGRTGLAQLPYDKVPGIVF